MTDLRLWELLIQRPFKLRQPDSSMIMGINDAHLPLNPNHDLQRTLAIHNTRKISKNLEISWQNTVIQIQAPERRNRLAGNHCLVIEKLDGDLVLEYQGELLSWCEFGGRPPEAAPEIDSKELQTLEKADTPKSKHKPKSAHPWKRLAQGAWRLLQEKRRRKKDNQL